MAANAFGLDLPGRAIEPPTAPIVPPPPPAPPVARQQAPMVGTEPVAPDIAPTPEPLPQAAPADIGALMRTLNIGSQVGAQGAAMPSYSQEAADRATAVSRFLEGQLKGLNRSEFGPIASAALRVIQNPQQAQFGTALADVQGQNITRAYNIANALAGLSRQMGKQLSPADILRATNAAAAAGNRNAGLLLTAAARFGAGYDDPAQAQEAFLSAAYEAQQRNPGAGPEIITNPAIMASARARLEGSGVNVKAPRSAAEAGGVATTSGGFQIVDGKPVNFSPFTAEKGRLTTDETNLNMAFRNAGGGQAGMQAAWDLWTAISEKRSSPGAGGSRKIQMDFAEQLAGADTALSVMDRIRSALSQRGASITGMTGQLSQMLAGGMAQLGALTGIDLSTATADQIGQQFRARFVNNREPGWEPATARAFSWLDADNSPEAQALKTNMLILGPLIAKSLDPQGRLSNQDVQQALMIIGQTGRNLLTDPRSMLRALSDVEKLITERIEARRVRIPPITEKYPQPIQFRQAPATTAAPAALTAPAGAEVLTPGRIYNFNPATGKFD